MTESAIAPAADTTEKLWVSQIADRVLAAFPNEPLYTCAAGISPSGIVHFGNFRDVITSLAVAAELQGRGHKTRLLFSWDNYDRFRKVPNGVDPTFSRYIGSPLTSVPDPWNEFESYARRYETEFERSMEELGITLDYRYQTQKYTSGEYADNIIFALQNRRKIAEVLLSFKTDKANELKGIDPAEFLESYYPITLYSRFSGTDKVDVLDYDGGSKLTYRCKITDKTETIDFRETPIVKLPWKVDWPMRWGVEKVHFEPGGKDHATPGGSYDVSAKIAREVFRTEPPVFQGYQFVGIQGMGDKMSGSKGDAVSPATLLHIYEPALLKWLYLRRNPTASFSLAFDSEVFRQYDEFDREAANLHGGKATAMSQKILAMSGVTPASASNPPIPFRQAVALGQIIQWNMAKLLDLLEKLSIHYDKASLESRLIKARTWLERYNPDEAIRLRDTVNVDYAAAMPDNAKKRIRTLRAMLGGDETDLAAIEAKIYDIPKDPALSPADTKAAQKKFFEDVYNLLISKDTGPRLSTFLWAVDRATVLRLLDIG